MLRPASTLHRVARNAPDCAGFIASAALMLLACGHDAPSDLPASSPASLAAARATPHEPNRTLQGDPPYGAASQDIGEHANGHYVCPMHPHVQSDKPGTCPECGMKLVRDSAHDSGHDRPAQPHKHGGEP